MSANAGRSNKTERSAILSFRHRASRRLHLEAIQMVRFPDGDLSDALREAVDEYIARHVHEAAEAA
jgi:hypothetical protein